MKEKILNTLRIIILSAILSTAIGYSLADFAPPPSCPPPCGNTPPPINVGAASQMREGKLFINNWLLANMGFFNILGVGTETPEVELHVKGVGGPGDIAVESATGNHKWTMSSVDRGGGRGEWVLNRDIPGTYPMIVVNDTGNIGFVGIPDTNYAVTVRGSLAYTGGSVSISDIRYKQNVEPIQNAMDKIMGLNGVMFDWNSKEYPNEHFKKGKDIGLIAQEAEKIIPEVVMTDSQGYKAIEYGNLSALLVEGIKQQQKEINELKIKNQSFKRANDISKKEINELKIKNQELENKVNKLIERLGQ